MISDVADILYILGNTGNWNGTEHLLDSVWSEHIALE